MQILAAQLGDSIGNYLLLVGAILLYVAAKTLSDLTWRRGHQSPLRHAIATWGPIGVVSLVATIMQKPGVAIGILFGTCVASLAMVLGFSLIVDTEIDSPSQGRKCWPFVLPVALLALLAGFTGRLTWVHAIMFAIEGAVVFSLWQGLLSDENSATPYHEQSVEPVPMPGGDEPTPVPDVKDMPRANTGVVSAIQIVLALILAILGAWGAIRGASDFHLSLFDEVFRWPVSTTGMIPILVLSPLLVAPMIFSGASIEQSSRLERITSTQVALVLMNLCVTLPIVILLSYPAQAGWFSPPLIQAGIISPPLVATTGPVMLPTDDSPSAPRSQPATSQPTISQPTISQAAISQLAISQQGRSQSTTSPSPLPSPADAAPAYTIAALRNAPPLVYPLVTWRIDTVMLVLLGLMLLPAALGRWKLGRAEGMALLGLYAAYWLMELGAAWHPR